MNGDGEAEEVGDSDDLNAREALAELRRLATPRKRFLEVKSAGELRIGEVEELLGQVHLLYGDRGSDGSLEEDVHVLRIVLACALAAEASGGSELAVRLFESVRVVADDCVWGAPDINRIIFLTLVVSYLHVILLLLSNKKVNLLLPNG